MMKSLPWYRQETSAAVEGEIFLYQPLRTVDLVFLPKNIHYFARKQHNQPLNGKINVIPQKILAN